MSDDARSALAAAYKAVYDLCSGKLRWEMRVPAEPDHDPDLIITNALRLAEAEIARLTRELDASRTLAAAEYADAGMLRAALRQIAVTPKAHKLVASICEIALGPKALDDIHGTPTLSG